MNENIDAGEAVVQERAVRLATVLERLAAKGLSQRAVAFELNVPAQYLSDLKHARRNLTEQFARRVAEVYRISSSWLLWGQGPVELPDLSGVSASAGTEACVLPVLTRPAPSNPRESPHWDGSMIALTGAAASMAQRGASPFVLRISKNDRLGRLRKNDLVLCSLDPRDDAEFPIVVIGGECFLVRRTKKGFEEIDGGKAFADAQSIGCCAAIVLGSLVQNAR